MLYSNLLSKVPNLSHGFTTKKDDGVPENLLRTKQVHGTFVYWANADKLDNTAKEEADGIATMEKGVGVSVQSADCCPILLCALDKSYHAVALMALHSGWRGSAGRIAAKGLSLLYRESSRMASVSAILVTIGPYISGAHFEIGEEVKNVFSLRESSIRPKKKEGKYLLDIGMENIRQISLLAQKLPTLVMIESLGLCTYTNPDLLPSYRREPGSPHKIISYLRMDI